MCILVLLHCDDQRRLAHAIGSVDLGSEAEAATRRRASKPTRDAAINGVLPSFPPKLGSAPLLEKEGSPLLIAAVDRNDQPRCCPRRPWC